jgi:ankyrin repeat protein
MLLSSGLNPDQGGEDGFTPLMTAAEAGHAQVITLLTQHPLCKINRKNRYGQVCSPPLS